MILIAVLVYGFIFGSFINALIWRIHQQSLDSDHSADKALLSIVSGRSMCPNCRHILAPKDLIPVFSWVFLKGKCRYCKSKISWQYPLIEIITAAIFLCYYLFWPDTFVGFGLVLFILSLIIVTGLIALAIYDLKWFLLPSKIIYVTLVFVIIYRIFFILSGHPILNSLFNIFWGILFGGGLFFVLYLISKGQWIGGGDIRLGALIGVLIGGPVDALIFLFIASLMGSLISLPLLAIKKYNRRSIIPFGPFLIMAAFVVQIFGSAIVSWAKNNYLIP